MVRQLDRLGSTPRLGIVQTLGSLQSSSAGTTVVGATIKLQRLQEEHGVIHAHEMEDLLESTVGGIETTTLQLTAVTVDKCLDTDDLSITTSENSSEVSQDWMTVHAQEHLQSTDGQAEWIASGPGTAPLHVLGRMLAEQAPADRDPAATIERDKRVALQQLRFRKLKKSARRKLVADMGDQAACASGNAVELARSGIATVAGKTRDTELSESVVQSFHQVASRVVSVSAKKFRFNMFQHVASNVVSSCA